MAMATTGGRGTRSGLNVTPLIDILLVLLIIFMVIQPTAQHGLDALVPQPPRSHLAETDPRTLVVSVRGTTAEPIYALNEQPVPLSSLQGRLEEVVQRTGTRTLFVHGEPGLDYAAVAPVFNAAHAAGATEIGVLTPRSMAPQ